MRQNSREARLIADFPTQNLPCFFCAYLLIDQKCPMEARQAYCQDVYKNDGLTEFRERCPEYQ